MIAAAYCRRQFNNIHTLIIDNVTDSSVTLCKTAVTPVL